MKQIIPFQKELLFKTKVSEITSISLEHTLSLTDDDTISGTFQISGDYKMTEGSINKEPFNFDLPFDITLTDKYEKDSITIDIDNFYYELVNNESLKVNIDVYIEGDKKEEIELPRLPEIEEEELEESIEYQKPKTTSLEEETNQFNIFENIDDSDTYTTYHVYILKETDTLDSIIEKYKTTREELELYNNLEELKPGVKIIIPSSNE